MIDKARLEMDARLHRVGRSVLDFFEADLSDISLTLPQAGRDHLDRFRSFVHSVYIEKYGFWPPHNVDDENELKNLYATLYSDFKCLFHHLVDPESSPSMADNVTANGGVCALQNIHSFDANHGYETLPHPLPLVPDVARLEGVNAQGYKRAPLKSLRNRRADREAHKELCVRALSDASNRDCRIMQCLLVRRYADFEQLSVFDDFACVSVEDGRKIRWILIYAVLQTLISVMQAPHQVRNTEGVGYSLCCQVPKVMPWRLHMVEAPKLDALPRTPTIEPDINYSHTHTHVATKSVPLTTSKSISSRGRRATLPVRLSSPAAGEATGNAPHSSLRRLMSRHGPTSTDKPPKRTQPAFCEIFVQGYGNGLNEVRVETLEMNLSSTSDDAGKDAERERSSSPPSPAVSVSRESSSASGYSNRSSTSGASTDEMPDMDHLSVVGDETRDPDRKMTPADTSVLDCMTTIHFNADTWDRVLDNWA